MSSAMLVFLVTYSHGPTYAMFLRWAVCPLRHVKEQQVRDDLFHADSSIAWTRVSRRSYLYQEASTTSKTY